MKQKNVKKQRKEGEGIKHWEEHYYIRLNSTWKLLGKVTDYNSHTANIEDEPGALNRARN
jgi:hypothetical protein